MKRITQWSLPSKLALLAFGLGLVAVFGDPYGGGAVTIHPQELATIVQKEVDHVAPDRLADWIIQQRSDYRLIDLRDAAAYATYHIPGAENVPITGFPDAALARNEKIVLYSDGGIHSAQAWFLLKAKGYDGVYILRGGLEEWKDQVLYPVLPANATPEQTTAFQRAKEVSAFFGGAPRLGLAPGAAASAAMPMPAPALPKVQAPSAPAAPAAAPKKKREGC